MASCQHPLSATFRARTGLCGLPDPLTIGRTFRPAGCYGFRLLGLEGADALLVDVTPTWPSLELRHGNPATTCAGARRGRPGRRAAHAAAGWVDVDRRAGGVTFPLEDRPPDRDLVHPYLAPAAAVAARWMGRDSFHAGAVVVGGGAWGDPRRRRERQEHDAGVARARPAFRRLLRRRARYGGGGRVRRPALRSTCARSPRATARGRRADGPSSATRDRWRFALGPRSGRAPAPGLGSRWTGAIAISLVEPAAGRLSAWLALIPAPRRCA